MQQEFNVKPHPTDFNPYIFANLGNLKKYPELERLYESTLRKCWDDKQVFDDLVAKHGPCQLPEEKRLALARIFSIIYYGEVVAMLVASQVVDIAPDLAAKFAAAGQTIDEARHVSVMGRYLNYLGVELPDINPFARAILEDVRHSKEIHIKLAGMQVFVENIAFNLFNEVARTKCDPVLTEVLDYVKLDEARHVGLGKNYLPQYLENLTARDAAGFAFSQFRWLAGIFFAIQMMKEDARVIGIDINKAVKKGMRDQLDIAKGMGRWKLRRGFVMFPNSWNDYLIDTFFPQSDDPRRWRQLLGSQAEKWSSVFGDFYIRFFAPRDRNPGGMAWSARKLAQA
ncbi:MAG: ferritin-like domain-containing protein [Deltaproteobacteria bacterium]|nr:ferritin-like domain-containing protein [Deltaproteobacteria bacterium]